MSRLRVFGGHRLCLLWGLHLFGCGPHFLFRRLLWSGLIMVIVLGMTRLSGI